MDNKIVVLMGGESAEREISILTGKAVEKALLSKGYDVVCFDADKTVVKKLQDEKNIKAVFIALHGPGGEDGRIQGVLDIMKIPYAGSGVLASALAMNKIMAKKVFTACGLPTPEYQVVRKNQSSNKFKLNYPVVVKPCSQGSAYGVNIVSNAKELKSALKEAFKLDTEVLIEKYISGRELTVSILGHKALPIIEIVPKKSFYDFEAKYKAGISKHIVPANLTDKLAKEIKNAALKAHDCLGCQDYSRVDIRLNNENEFYILEINTLPGMTDLSLFPDAARSVGIEFPELIEKLIKMAIKKG